MTTLYGMCIQLLDIRMVIIKEEITSAWVNSLSISPAILLYDIINWDLSSFSCLTV